MALTPALYAEIEPLIRCFATDVTHCGEVGAGQVTKILNNMVLFETVNALAEAVAVAKHNGVDPKLLLDTLSKGSADSFALRNHGMKAIVPGNFPERAFSTEYALKDLSYALELAARCRLQDSRRGVDRHRACRKPSMPVRAIIIFLSSRSILTGRNGARIRRS